MSILNYFFMILQKAFLESDNESTKTLKSLSATRWSARDDVCQSVDCVWNETQEALLIIEDDSTEKLLVRNETEGLLWQFSSLETAFMTTFWSFLLHRFNVTNKHIQADDIDLHTVVELYNFVIDLIGTCRGISIFFSEAGYWKGQKYWVQWNLTSKAT